MTTAGIMEIRVAGEKVFIYGTHDSYPDGWPALAAKYLLERGVRDLGEVVNGVLRQLRDWDFNIHMQTAVWHYYRDWKEREREIRRIVRLDFRQVSETDIPKNLEKGWDYWYIVDLDSGVITVRRVKPKVYTDTRGKYIYGEEEITEFYGPLRDYLSRYISLNRQQPRKFNNPERAQEP